MAKIDTDYQKLLNASEELRKLIYDADGLVVKLNAIKALKDDMSKYWKMQDNINHLNALVALYSKLRSSVNELNSYRKMLYDAGTEYKAAASDNEAAAKGIK
ncbi:MAG: hypothetical protein NC240_09180 [Clostridium sp.]|nr:hypothetical protein [Clostridium sp.]